MIQRTAAGPVLAAPLLNVLWRGLAWAMRMFVRLHGAHRKTSPVLP
jgi:hypothetical protein